MSVQEFSIIRGNQQITSKRNLKTSSHSKSPNSPNDGLPTAFHLRHRISLHILHVTLKHVLRCRQVEQSDRPDPVSILTRTESSASKDLKIRARSTIIDLVREFRDLGRFNVTHATPSDSRFTSIRFSCDDFSIFLIVL